MPSTGPKSNLSLRIASALCILCLASIAAKAQTATTQVATGVTDIAATLHGVVNPASESVYSYCTFQFGTDTGYGQTVNADLYSLIGTTPIAVTANPPGLLPNTTYHYRVVMTPYSGDGYLGADMTITTGPPATLPSFEFVRADTIGDTAASFTVFNPNSGGSAATISVEYGTDTTYGSVYVFPDIVPVNTTLPYPSARVAGLMPNTAYHWRFKLTNLQGSSYSTDQSFTTMRTPVLTTGVATNIASLAATFNGTVNPMEQVFQVSFEFGTDTSYGSQIAATPQSVYDSGITAVSARFGYLQPGTTYHYRVIAFASGIGAVPGPDQVFTTQSDIASVYPTNVTDLGATVAASVDVGSTYSRHNFWFEYGTSTDYGARSEGPASTQNDPLHPGLKLVTAQLYNLLPGTLYHCRIKVQISDYGPVFSGSDFTFTTAAPATAPTVLPSGPNPRTSVAPTGATLSPVEAWRQNFFNTIDDTGDHADLANPTGDGVSNLLKYALGLDPTSRVAAPTPYPATASDGETYLTFYFSRVSLATDLTYEVQVTGNLTEPWTTIATSSGGTPFTGSGLVQDISYTDWSSGGGGYFPIYPPSPPSYLGGDYFVIVRDTVPRSQASARFMRLRVIR